MSERSKSKIQGEGDYEGARRYRRGVENYVKTADIDRAALILGWAPAWDLADSLKAVWADTAERQ